MYSPVGSTRITSGYLGGFRSTGGHSGIDFGARTGTPIRSVTTGVVLSAGRAGAYGNLVKVRHTDGSVGYYAHMSRFGVRAGSRVTRGSVVGFVGSTGNSTGPHLHFEIRRNGRPVNPTPWLGRGVSGGSSARVAERAYGGQPSQTRRQRSMGLGAEQLRNARTIISVGRSMGATQRDLVIAIMTAMQESTLRNLNYGDRDSLGLFQQRAGWGSASQRRNPQYAARKFFSTLFKVRGRTGMSLTGAAQAVQRSAFPNAYAKWESLARGVLGGSTNLGAEASVFEEEEGFAPEPEERDFNPIPAMLAQGPNLDVVRLPGTNDQEEPEGPEGSAPFNLREMLYG